MRLKKDFIYDSKNDTYGTYANLAKIVDETNSVADGIDASIAATVATYKEKLSADASTFITVGDRREDLKITVDYIVNRGGVIEEGRTSLINIDEYTVNSSVNANGDDGFELSGRFESVNFYGNNIGDYEWMVKAGDKIFGIPLNGTNFIEYNTVDNSVNVFGDLGDISYKFYYGLLGSNNYIYAIPYSYNYVVKINPETREITFLGDPDVISSSLYKWREAYEYNGNIYAVPISDNYASENPARILKINIATDIISFIDVAGTRPGSLDSWGGIKRINNKIYALPNTANDIIEFNLETEHYSLLGADSSALYNEGFNRKYTQDGLIEFDNKLYAIPHRGKYIIEINSDDSSLNFYTSSEIDTTTRKWSSSIIVNDKLYAVPFLDTRILEFNLKTKDISFYDNIISGSASGYIRTISYNNKIYSFPHSEIAILEFNTLDGSVNFHGDFGSNINKFGEMCLSNEKIYTASLNVNKIYEFNVLDNSIGVLGEFISGGDHNYKNYIQSSDNKIHYIPNDAPQVCTVDPLKRELQLVSKDTSTNTADASISYTLNKIKF